MPIRFERFEIAVQNYDLLQASLTRFKVSEGRPCRIGATILVFYEVLKFQWGWGHLFPFLRGIKVSVGLGHFFGFYQVSFSGVRPHLHVSLVFYRYSYYKVSFSGVRSPCLVFYTRLRLQWVRVTSLVFYTRLMFQWGQLGSPLWFRLVK